MLAMESVGVHENNNGLRRGSLGNLRLSRGQEVIKPPLRAGEEVTQKEQAFLARKGKMQHHEANQTSAPLISAVGDYNVHNAIGKGGRGQVFYATHHATGQPVAIKQIDKKKHRASDVSDECTILHDCVHPHICQMIVATENDHRMSLVLEYAAKGDMHAYLRKYKLKKMEERQEKQKQEAKEKAEGAGGITEEKTRRGSGLLTRRRRGTAGEEDMKGGFDEPEARRIFKQLLSAVKFLHSTKGIAHRDIKPDNILFRENGDALLCDFSLATTWSPYERRTSSCGTLHYCAPEVILGNPYAGPEVDIWSLGAVLFFMLSGKNAFSASSEFEVLKKIKNGKRSKLGKEVSREAKDLVDRMLQPHPLKRLTIGEVCKHPWVTGKTLTRTHGSSGSLTASPRADKAQQQTQDNSPPTPSTLLSRHHSSISSSASASPRLGGSLIAAKSPKKKKRNSGEVGGRRSASGRLGATEKKLKKSSSLFTITENE